jgi:hypothetical protein
MEMAAFVHTHGGGPNVNNFSGSNNPDDIMGEIGGAGDMDFAFANKIPIYLINPRGNLKRYDPPKDYFESNDGTGIRIRNDMPYNPRFGTDDKSFNYWKKHYGKPAYDYKKYDDDATFKPKISDAIKY